MLCVSLLIIKNIWSFFFLFVQTCAQLFKLFLKLLTFLAFIFYRCECPLFFCCFFLGSRLRFFFLAIYLFRLFLYYDLFAFWALSLFYLFNRFSSLNFLQLFSAKDFSNFIHEHSLFDRYGVVPTIDRSPSSAIA